MSSRGGRNRIGRREKWPKKSWEEGEIGRKSREKGKKKPNRLGRREKLAQKAGRREIYPLFPPPPPSGKSVRVLYQERMVSKWGK